MQTHDFFYELPEALIAQHPLEQRDHSRLMVLQPPNQPVHDKFFNLKNYLRPGDCLVLNNTRVIPARLIGQRSEGDAVIEFLLLERLNKDDWEILVKPGKKCRVGQKVTFLPERLWAEIIEIKPDGNRIARFYYQGIWEALLDEAGAMPLPPYIHEKLDDKERYQTVYSKIEGSAAAPTAGLHFTADLLAALKEMGIQIAEVTLNVGLGTFRPVKATAIEKHQMHSEIYSINQAACDLINQTKKNGGRVIAVGTTSARVLESSTPVKGAEIKPFQGRTEIFIYPGYIFKMLDGLITNFHLPESTLLMLVSALAGRSYMLQCYQAAVAEKYRFFSFGDAMFILP